MITENTEKSTKNWHDELRNIITDVHELLDLLELPTSLAIAAQAAGQAFSLRVPRSFVARMRKRDPYDPLLRQVLPLDEELNVVEGFVVDPVGDLLSNKRPGLLHKYQGRVLLTVTGSCAINCRYCFRRAFPYAENNPGKKGWASVLEYIAADKSISEVIFSGGDPLLANDFQLAALSTELEKISHLKRLRIHSRLPVVIPSRINDEFIQWFTDSRLQPVLVLHINHAQEIDVTLQKALKKIKDAGIALLNQSVLLKGVNDDLNTLITLSETLFDSGVLPYYLHILDKVQGAAHFDVPREKARQLHQSMQTSLPGYLVPRLVEEIAGEKAKVLLQ